MPKSIIVCCGGSIFGFYRMSGTNRLIAINPRKIRIIAIASAVSSIVCDFS